MTLTLIEMVIAPVKIMKDYFKRNFVRSAVGKTNESTARNTSKLCFGFKIKSSMDQITKSIQMFDELLEQNNCCCSRTKSELSTALSEALANAIVHGNKIDPDKFVDLRVQIDKDRMILHIKDSGAGFDFKNLPDPLAPENIKKRNGRGVYLMSMLVDNVKFIRHRDGMEVILTKLITPKNNK
ncbi:MAG: ATP-binding protein [bacterium]|jgi:serine/threonine-protein kinase RsbW|nr:ATP-binding protein [bacterium]